MSTPRRGEGMERREERRERRDEREGNEEGIGR